MTLFDVRTQKLITQFTMENKQYPIKPTYVSDLGEGFLFFGNKIDNRLPGFILANQLAINN
jgi:hypothetical protein